DRTTSQVRVGVATDLMRAGNFSQISQTIYDPLTRVYNSSGAGSATPFPGNIIPTGQISPQTLALLKYYPSTTVPGAALTSTNFIRNALSPTDSTQFNQQVELVRPLQWGQRFAGCRREFRRRRHDHLDIGSPGCVGQHTHSESLHRERGALRLEPVQQRSGRFLCQQHERTGHARDRRPDGFQPAGLRHPGDWPWGGRDRLRRSHSVDYAKRYLPGHRKYIDAQRRPLD